MFLAALLFISLMVEPGDACQCLPKGIKPTDIVSTQVSKPGADSTEIKKITVKDKLSELKADCRKRKLIDSSGREIYFYRLQGCWGNPPIDYQEILARQNRELEQLKKRYRVIEMTCNPSGGQPL